MNLNMIVVRVYDISKNQKCTTLWEDSLFGGLRGLFLAFSVDE